MLIQSQPCNYLLLPTKKKKIASYLLCCYVRNKGILLLTFILASLSHLCLPIDFATTPHTTERITVIV